jgi:glycosyltransferase involved in cell wall biosynthesis
MSERLPVHFVGALSRTEMPFALAAADIVVVPSLWDEPFGTIVVEAMAAGAPVIAYRSGGIPESIEDNITGILVQPGNMSGLADAIIYLYQHTPVRRQMAAAARQRAADRFTWEIAAQKIDRIYEMALSKRVNHRHR